MTTKFEINGKQISHKDLNIVRDTLTDDYNKLSNSELQDEIKYSFDEEVLDELVDNVTQQYPNQMQTFIPGFHD